MSQLCDRLLTESAERILGSTFVYMYEYACTCISMGVCTHALGWVCVPMCESAGGGQMSAMGWHPLGSLHLVFGARSLTSLEWTEIAWR